MTGHDKGRDCARTDEVLDNYRRRAVTAETELAGRRGPGRPATGVRVDIRIPQELIAKVDELAETWELSRAVVQHSSKIFRRRLLTTNSRRCIFNL